MTRADVRHSRVLIVDDEPANVSMLEAVLEEAGFSDIVSTTESRRTLDLVSQINPDILLLDLMMPHLDGHAILAAMPDRLPPGEYLPILVLTADVAAGSRQRALAAGAHDYVTKPIDVEEVVLRVTNLLTTRALHTALQRQNEALDVRVRARTAELEAAQQHQLDIKDRFLTHISHELRSPLANIYQFVSLVVDGIAGATTADQQEYLGIALAEAKTLCAMVNDLLDAVRADRGDLELKAEPQDLAVLIADAAGIANMRGRARGVSVRFLDCAGACRVIADRDRTAHVLDCLVHNAIKSSPDGGSVSLRVTSHAAEPEFWRVTVQDTGSRAADDFLDRMFDRLAGEEDVSDLGRSGIGIGLYLCRRVVELQGGRIWAENAPEGRVVAFTLRRT